MRPAFALDELMEQYWDPMMRYAYRRVRDWHDAHDICQNAFINAMTWVRRHPQTPIRNVRAWLLTIARHEIVQYYKRMGKLPMSSQPISQEAAISKDPGREPDENSPNQMVELMLGEFAARHPKTAAKARVIVRASFRRYVNISRYKIAARALGITEHKCRVIHYQFLSWCKNNVLEYFWTEEHIQLARVARAGMYSQFDPPPFVVDTTIWEIAWDKVADLGRYEGLEFYQAAFLMYERGKGQIDESQINGSCPSSES